MKISIDSLSYDELVELNYKIVERLKYLDFLVLNAGLIALSNSETI